MTHGSGRIIRSRDLVAEFVEKELSRRAFVRRAALAGAGGAALAGLPGCPHPPEDDDSAHGDDDDSAAPQTSLVGLGSGKDFDAALEAAMAETVARGGLAGVVSPGDVVFLKPNCNSGDDYPYSTQGRMIEKVGGWAWDLGASRVIVGDRSFYGYSAGQTLTNMNNNGVADAAEAIGAELIAFSNDDEWLEITEDEADLWSGGFRYPRVVVEADVIVNLPVMKTHFIAGFTMSMKNMIGLCHPEDRARTGNLDYHSQLHRKIAQLNQHITPTLHLLDGWQACVRGGPTPWDGAGGLVASPGVVICSTDRIAADVTGLAVLKQFAATGEEVLDYGAWEHPQIEAAIEAGVGITGPDAYGAAGPTVPDLQTYLDEITG